jgi:hypothetical protein
MKLRVLVAGLMFGVAAFGAETGAELFQKAVTQERAAGNLEEAIKLYQRVATEFASDRALAAKALVQEARCYEKLGQDKALKLYEQVARDFKDQREPAATASARLATLRQGNRAAVSTAMTLRKIEAPVSNPGFLPDFANTDGQRIVYQDKATGALMVGDLASGESRVIFKPKAGVLDQLFVSKDMSMVFAKLTGPNGLDTHVVVRTDGTGHREIPGYFTGRPDWSWDNRYVLVCESQPDGPRQPLRVSVADGETVKLRTPDNRCMQLFSPDGRFIATAESSHRSPIFVGPSEGGEQQQLLDNASLIGWTRDGRYLAIALDRSGSEALYLLPMKGGRQAGDPVFIRYGSFLSGRTTGSGALVHESTPEGGTFAALLGTLNSSGRLDGWEPLSLSGSGKSLHYPAWSPDSSRIAYVTSNHAAGQNAQVVRVHKVAGGEERELYKGGSFEMSCVWAAQHPNLFCGQIMPQGTTEAFSISIESGRAEPLGSVSGNYTFLFGSPDDRAIYMAARGASELIRWEIATRMATSMGRGTRVIASPDERWISRLEKGKIEIRPMNGGDWKPLISGGTQIAFTPDGNWLLFHGVDAGGKDGFFRVATAGGRPERLGDFPTTSQGPMWVSPDGRKVIADTLNPFEVWLLENFEPKQQAAK